ncbi:glutamate synthase central domain-containing protein, partial [Escherichia coli]|uniref:glutamate synthase central domain-containing protein n=1 Tax=Escherichia coli TaxID=562 RepID=UPI004068C53C
MLSNEDLAKLANAGEQEKYSAFQAARISGLYPVAHGGRGMADAIARIRREVSAAIEDGKTLIFLTDRDSDERNAPIPSLLLTS